MKTFLFSFFLVFLGSQTVHAKNHYMENYSCKECHETIYNEYQASSHAQNYFNNELHRKIADKVSSTQYSCATCHMPMADNIDELVSGKARPDINNKTHTDGVSCFFCHTIAYVKQSHKFNLNIESKQAKGYKPTLYGRLLNPEESEKHSSVTNPVYAKNVCKGCHSHKVNNYNATAFRAMDEEQNSLDCIKCHMPQVNGGVEKMDKRTRGKHVSHKFFGIHDSDFRQQGIDINVTVDKDQLYVELNNKMAHPLIIQPARAKFLKIELKREDKILWSNYQKDPREDKQGFFAYSFSKSGTKIIIPDQATESTVNNIAAKKKKILHYMIPLLQKGDQVHVYLYVQLAKQECLSVIDLQDKNLTVPQIIKEYIYIHN